MKCLIKTIEPLIYKISFQTHDSSDRLEIYTLNDFGSLSLSDQFSGTENIDLRWKSKVVGFKWTTAFWNFTSEYADIKGRISLEFVDDTQDLRPFGL